MNNFIFTAIVVLAAARAKVQIKDNQTNKERKDKSGGEWNRRSQRLPKSPVVTHTTRLKKHSCA